MNENSDPTERRAGDYLLFAAVFIGFIVGGVGVILSSPGIAFTGAAISLLVFWCGLGRRPTES
jgi:hypothetical protein